LERLKYRIKLEDHLEHHPDSNISEQAFR